MLPYTKYFNFELDDKLTHKYISTKRESRLHAMLAHIRTYFQAKKTQFLAAYSVVYVFVITQINTQGEFVNQFSSRQSVLNLINAICTFLIKW